MNFSFTSSLWLLLVLATQSVIAKKGKKTKTTKNKNNLGPVIGGSANLNCDPMSPWGDKYQSCHNEDCASDVWKDGCLACMCYNDGNASWCDGTQSAYYDSYFEEYGENQFGDSNRSNSKCNTHFSQLDVSCQWDWECENELECNDSVCVPGGGGNYCDRMSSTEWYDGTIIRSDGCEDNDCARTHWHDGCKACMCYNQGNDSWCDGTKSSYYDNYYKEKGENPFGDSNSSNRKCNTDFAQYGIRCAHDWQCESGLECRQIANGGVKACMHVRGNYKGECDFSCDPMKGSSYDGCIDKDCASTNWEDGCEACMCFNEGNASWCDGTKSAYYDNYYQGHGENPFGDSNRNNRKCNTIFSPKGACCKWNWECEGGQDKGFCAFDGPREDEYGYDDDDYVPTLKEYCVQVPQYSKY